MRTDRGPVPSNEEEEEKSSLRKIDLCFFGYLINFLSNFCPSVCSSSFIRELEDRVNSKQKFDPLPIMQWFTKCGARRPKEARL
jgi:hypothetical protein